MSKSIAEPEYVFAIYSCKKNISKAINMYNTYLKDKFPITIKFFIICGNKINTNYVIQNDLLILNVGDDYENLTNKTVTLFCTIIELYPNIKGCFKCDDDIIPNINAIYSFLYKLTLIPDINYSGKSVLYNYFTDKENRINKTDEINLKEFLKNEKHFRYCAGPMYYLSNKSLQTFTQPNIQLLNQEDVAVGYHLRKNNIYIHNNNIFSDSLCKINTNSYHNRQHKQILYINLSGGLGNQMFQIASAYGLSRKLNMHLVAVNYNCNNIHNKVIDYFENNIFDKVSYIEDAARNINFSNVYIEPDKDCFVYNEKILTDKLGTNDILVKGFFQNEKYFKEYKDEILDLFKNKNLYITLLSILGNLKMENNSYFIHVRRGDYVNNPLYQIDYDKYFKSAIEYIQKRDKTAHFIIFSNDIEFCQTYHVFNNINCKYCSQPNETLCLYLMSQCLRGGICSNSSFSWWGSYLNENPNKIVIFPDKWYNIDGIKNDIYYEGSVILEA